MLTGLGITAITLLHRTFAHILVIYPEYATLDSVYLDARGFPNPMWVKNDPAISGYGEPKEAIVWSGIRGNWILWTIGLYVLESPVILIAVILARMKRSKGSANILPGGAAPENPAAHQVNNNHEHNQDQRNLGLVPFNVLDNQLKSMAEKVTDQ